MKRGLDSVLLHGPDALSNKDMFHSLDNYNDQI